MPKPVFASIDEIFEPDSDGIKITAYRLSWTDNPEYPLQNTVPFTRLHTAIEFALALDGLAWLRLPNGNSYPLNTNEKDK